MASIAPLPPTPQQSFSHMAVPLASPSDQPSGMPTYSSHGYSMSFDSATQQHSAPPYVRNFGAAGFPNGPVVAAPYSRSFAEGYGPGPAPARGYEGRPQIYTAVYSGVSVYEMEVHGVACMRRRSDGWLNATQILKVAGVDKGKRTKVLEKEILPGEHEKVQGGYGKYQGTWISYRRGREFCHQYGVEELLRPLLDYDVSADGSGGAGQQETPTKEQAMAANRKRIYYPAVDTARAGGGPVTNGTFFQNISSTTSTALSALNKAARLNSPTPRPASAQRLGSFRKPSPQDGFPGGSQQSMISDGGYNVDVKHDSGYNFQPNGEPPRKRIRPDSQDGMAPSTLPLDASMRSATPTEPNESFVYNGNASHEYTNGSGDPIALQPLPSPKTDIQNERIGLILDLFAEAGRTDYTNHPALVQLSGEDLNLPLDASANNALHWAATLAKVSLLKLLIKKGANIYRGNAAGQSPLISAVLVNNSWEHSCFPELLELLGPLIEVRDLQGRTILHHIAVSSGIKGRAPSSKYYLEALLEFLVRIGTQPNMVSGFSAAQIAATIQDRHMNGENTAASRQESAPSSLTSSKSAVSLVRFLSHIVNARDKAGNTALNLVARIGNRNIIQQLLEIHADPSLPNHKGVSAKDFGVAADIVEQTHANGGLASQQSTQSLIPTTFAAGSQDSNLDVDTTVDGSTSTQVNDLGQDVITSMTTMLTQSLSSHKDLLRQRTEQIDQLNQQLQEFGSIQKAELERVKEFKRRVHVRAEQKAKVTNLQRCNAEKRRAGAQRRSHLPTAQPKDGDLDWLNDLNAREIVSFSPSNPFIDSPNALQRQFITSTLPSSKDLLSLIGAYQSSNGELQQQADMLKSKSIELESMYRRVVALCTSVPEERVEESLAALVAAVESEKGALSGEQEVGRVREFLRRVDGVIVGPDA